MLDLTRNPLRSIGGIEKFTELRELNLCDTQVTSIVNELDVLPHLESVDISGRLDHIFFKEL